MVQNTYNADRFGFISPVPLAVQLLLHPSPINTPQKKSYLAELNRTETSLKALERVKEQRHKVEEHRWRNIAQSFNHLIKS